MVQCVTILTAAEVTSDLSWNLSVLEVHSSLPALAIYLAGWIAKSSSLLHFALLCWIQKHRTAGFWWVFIPNKLKDDKIFWLPGRWQPTSGSYKRCRWASILDCDVSSPGCCSTSFAQYLGYRFITTVVVGLEGELSSFHIISSHAVDAPNYTRWSRMVAWVLIDKPLAIEFAGP